MPTIRTSPPARRRAALATALIALSGTVTLAVASGAQATAFAPSPGALPRPGNLLVATSVYRDDTNIVAGGTQLPPGCGSAAAPCGTAVSDGTYPYVFNNASVDGSFGVTSPITLDELSPSGRRLGSIAVPNSTQPGVSADANQMVTSFSSKSELALNLSTDGKYVTFMGYNAAVGTADVSNANTPGDIDPTSIDPGAAYREVAQLGANGRFQFTETNAYSGDNGRAALLNDEPGADLYYTAGNAGNGANPEPAAVVTGAGAQLVTPSKLPTAQQTPGQPTPLGSFNLTQLGDSADKSAKDDNYRGLTAYDNVLYYTKGSGGNGADTVYFVDTSGSSCTSGTGLPKAGAALPTTSNLSYSDSDPALGLTAKNPGLTPENMCVLKGFPTTTAKNASDASAYPFGLWFANPYTLYVADEGSGDNTYSATGDQYTAAAASTTAGLQKWVYNPATEQWNLAYTLQTGLKLGTPYSVAGYPTGDNNGPGGTGLPWAPATDGLRNITGKVNPNGTVSIWGVTSTVSGSGDQGADPNQLVGITDKLAASTLPANESFRTVDAPTDATVVRGVSFTPGTQAASGDRSCAGNTYTDTTVYGDLTVPAGSTCTLTDATVEGNVQVERGGSLLANGSTVYGGLQASGAAWIDVQGGRIGGDVQVRGTTGTPDAGSASSADDLCGATVGGDVQVQGNGPDASFDLGAAPDCATALHVGGSLQVDDNAGAVAIGPAANGQGDSVRGSVEVSGNTGGGSLTDASAGGSCRLEGDRPGITGSGNTAAGRDTCNATA